MALTPAEQAELEQLEAELGGNSPNLSPAEAAELQSLEAELGGSQPLIDPEAMHKALATPEGAESFLQAQGEGVGETFLESFSSGVEDIGGGILQRLTEAGGFLGFEMDEELKRFQDIEEDRRAEGKVRSEARPVTSFVGKTAGQIAALPVGGAVKGSLALRVGSQGLAGALAGYAQPTLENEDPRVNALVGFLAGGTLAGLSEPFARFARKQINATKGVFSKESVAKLIKQADDKGVPIFADDVAESPFLRFLGRAAEEVPVTGTGPNRVRQAGAQKQLVEKFMSDIQKGVRGFGDDVDLSQVQLKSLVDKFDKRRGTKNKLWERVISKAGDGQVALNKTRTAAMTEVVEHISQVTGTPRQTVQSALSPALEGRQSIKPILDALDKTPAGDSGLVTELLKFAKAPQGDLRYTIQDLKPALNQLMSKGARGEQAVIKDKSVPILARVKEALDADVDSFASQAPGVKEALAKANNFTQRFNIEGKKTVLRQLLSEGGQEVPEKIMAVLRQGKVSQNNLIYKNLNLEGRTAIKIGIVREAFENSLDEQGNLLVGKFVKALDNDKLKKATGVFFRGRDAQELKGLTSLLKATEASQRQFGEGVGINVLGRQLISPSGVQAARGSATGGLGILALFDPATAATTAAGIGTIGGIARGLLQSKTGRNLLVGLGKTTPGTAKFDNLLQKAINFSQRSITANSEE